MPYYLLLQTQSDSSIATATWVIAGATVIYVLASIALWLTTSKNTSLTKTILEAAHRPYLGVVPQRAIVKDLATQKITDDLGFLALITNHGSVPANNVRLTVKLSIEGYALNVTHPERNIFSVPPKGDVANITTLDSKESERVIKSNSMTMVFTILYEGITKDQQYSYEFEGVYYHDRNIVAPLSVTST